MGVVRRLYSWPSWLLRAVIRYRVPGGLVADAYIELWERARSEVDRTVERYASDSDSGPWAVAIPEGFH